MQCEQVEIRLNRLLDERRAWSDDSAVEAHCARCPSCRQIARAYAVVDVLFVDAGAAPELSRDFSTRVLAEVERNAQSPLKLRLVSNPHGEMPTATGTKHRTEERSAAGRPEVAHLLVAAVLLMAVLPTAWWIKAGSTPSPSSPVRIGENLAVQGPWHLQDGLAHFWDDDHRLSEQVWRSTGRGLAELPHQLRRAAALSETAPLTGAIRPVAVAWHALRRVFPSESMRSGPTTGETSLLADLPSDVWV